MPGRDGTGPMGQGAMTGGGFGDCMMSERTYRLNRNRIGSFGRGQGFGRGRGICRNFGNRFFEPGLRRFRDEVVFSEKEYLENELKSVEMEAGKIKERLQKLEQDKD